MSAVHTGIDRIASGSTGLSPGARLALLTNRAARTSDGQWTGETLRESGYGIDLLLTPEHGLDATAGAGAPIPHSSLGDTPVLSMYGADWGPVEGALSRMDGLVVDLPDVGCRYYTYPWTLREALKLAARQGVPVTVLDRPNPLGGVVVEGNLPDYTDSAVCAAAVPVRHSLTLGELALWHQRALNLQVGLTVVTVEGWRREALWPETGLPWVPPSPALPSFEAALAYPGTCLLEGTNVSEGRGTESPFLLLGAPFVDGNALAETLGAHPFLEAASVTPTDFTPTSSKWASDRCHGIRLEIVDLQRFRPAHAGLAIVIALARIEGFEFRPAHFDALAGTASWRERIQQGHSAEDIAGAWPADEERFLKERDTLSV